MQHQEDEECAVTVIFLGNSLQDFPLLGMKEFDLFRHTLLVGGIEVVDDLEDLHSFFLVLLP